MSREARFAEYVRRLLGRRESTELNLIPDLLPIIEVIDAAAPDVLALRGERLAGSTFFQAASAGNYSTFRLRNPTGSGMLAHVRTLTVGTLVSAAVCRCGVDTGSDLGTGQSEVFRDFRLAGAPVMVATSGAPAAVATTGLLHAVYAGVQTATVIDANVVVPPGYCFWACLETVNVALLGCMEWMERASEPDELNFR